ncbi:MAG: hypothetical protein HY699_22380 [Deltaproteobacteria bacterium]|nr:hypothetical protein [Deltaproteobacteria bacterium]
MAWGLRLARRKAEPDQPATTPEPARVAEPAASGGERPAPTQLHAVGTNLNSLRQKLLDLYGQRLPRDEFAQQAAQFITRAMNAAAVALLAYEQRRDRLALLAATGLNDEACQILGGGVAGPGWDIPMRGLTNRRISVIEAAHQNPFVPRPLIEVSPRRLTIATLPFFHGYARAGVLVLFANKPHGFSDAQLQALGQALKVCALAFVELPHSTVGSAVPSARAGSEAEAQPAPLALADRQRAAEAEELARLRAAFDESLWRHAKELAETRRAATETLEAERQRFAHVAETVAALEGERDRLASQLAATRGELASFADARTALDSQRTEARRLNDALTAATANAERTTLQLGELQRAHRELVERYDTALRQHSEQVQASAGERERDAATMASLRERLGTLEAEHTALSAAAGELRAAHEQVLGRLEAVQARAAELQQQLAASLAAHQALQAQHAELREAYEATQLGAAATEQAVTRLQQQLDEQRHVRDELSQELAQAQAAAAALHQALATAHEAGDASATSAKLSATRLAQVEKKLAQLRAEHVAALSDAEHERQRLNAELRVWSEREPTWAAQLQQLSERAEAAEAERTRLAEALARLETEQLAAAEHATGQLQALDETTRQLQAEHAQLQAQLAAAEAARAAVQGDREQLEALCAALRAEQDRGQAERNAAVNARDQQIADLHAQLGELRARYEHDAGERSSYAERLAQERDALAAARRQLEAAVAEQLARAQQLESELATTTARHATVQAEFEQNRTHHGREAELLRRQLAEVQAALGGLQRERDETTAAYAAASESAEAMQRDVEQLRAELAAAAESLAEQRAHAEVTAATWRSELTTAQAEHDAAQQRLAKREAELAALQAQIAELATSADQERADRRAELEQLAGEWENERAALHARAGELEAELERTRKEHLALAEALAVDESQPALEIERCVIPGLDDLGEPALDDTLVAEAEPVLEEEPAPATIAVVDGELGCAMVATLAAAGWNAVGCEPTEAAVTALAGKRLGAVAVNVMSGSNGWQLVRALRAHADTEGVPLLLYARASEKAGFCFGPSDCVLWPNEPQRLLDALARLAPRAKRVLAMSADIDVVAGVREQLTGAGLSAAVTLDGKQALDLLPSVRPDAIVLHLSPNSVDVFRTIAGLRSNGSAALPVVLIMDREPSNRDGNFLTGGSRTLANKATFNPTAVAEGLARVVPQ